MKDLFGEESIPPSEYYSQEQKDKWYKAFIKWANNEYFEKGDISGRFCCGYEWCCDLCKQEKVNGCEDCVDNIIEQLKTKNILIDYNDYDFEKWENLAKGE